MRAISSLEDEKKRLIKKYKDKKYEYSQPVEGNFSCLKEGEFDWWKYKFYIKQIEKAEEGKNIEEYFAEQNLKFDLSKDFNIKEEVVFTAGGDLLSGSQITPETTKKLWDDIKDFYYSICKLGNSNCSFKAYRKCTKECFRSTKIKWNKRNV